jgi:tetratricopeptide (TPR) repeat protein
MHRPTRLSVYAFVVMTAFAGVSSFAACAKQRRSNGPTPSVSNVNQEVVDDVLLAYLSNARSLHHEADMQEDAGNLTGAIATLQRLLDKPAPGKSPEVDEVLADTHARIGELRAQVGDFDAAEKDIDVGLGLAPDISYFRGHLLEVRGVIEEKRSKSLADKGDVVGAAKAKEAAMAAYEAAIGVQDEVIRRGTADGGTP